MCVSKNRGTPKSSILIGLFIINHPFWGTTIFGNIHMKLDIFWQVGKGCNFDASALAFTSGNLR